MEKTIQEKIYSLIPITRHMGVKVESLEIEKVVLSAPLDSNKNHKNTGFGGSLASLGLLSGWLGIINKLQESKIEAEVVAKDMSVEFFAPVKGDFQSICKLPRGAKWHAIIEDLQKTGKAKIVLRSSICVEEKEAAVVTGTYAAISTKYQKA